MKPLDRTPRYRRVLETTLLAVGAAQGLFLTFGLLAKQTANRGATRSLAALVGVLTVLALGQLVRIALPTLDLRWFKFLSINAELAMGPLLLLFARYLFDPERTWQAWDTRQFVPLATGLGLWGGLNIVPWIRGLEPSLAPYATLALGFAGLKAALFYAYLFGVFQTFRRGLGRGQRIVAGRRDVNLGWLLWWVLFLALTVSALYALVFVEALIPSWSINTDLFSNWILVVLLYLLSTMALLRPWVLSARPRPQPDDRLAADARRLEAWFESERPHLDPELTLRDLAADLGLTQNRLSIVLNEGLRTGFYELVNRYRLRHFERLAADRELRERTVLDLAFESGFASKASFYRSFRDAHDTTPTAFRKQQLG